jgi:hypothetical protein
VKVKFPKALELQCIPEDPDLWKVENYEKFLEERRQMLAKHLNTFLEKITATGETVAPVSLEDMIAEGESDELEFKSTLRWDLKEGTVNKKLEDVIIKTVAAFANSDGGSVLIGVDDDGNVLGLDPEPSFTLHCMDHGCFSPDEAEMCCLPNATFDFIFAKGLTASRPIVTQTNASDHWPVTRNFRLH